jgi:hypothetical protein
MSTYIYFTDEQKNRANAVDLEAWLLAHGEKLLRSGREKRLASDHSITVHGNEWFDHATGEGGLAINFLQRHYRYSFPEAVTALLGGEQGTAFPTAEKKEMERKPFALPPSNDNMRRVFAYLVKQRHIDRDILSYFARENLIYEDAEYHNAVFVGMDENGVARHAHKRSTNSYGDTFRINVEGSDPKYSFGYNGEGTETLYVFEAPIDLLSFISLYSENWQSRSYVSLCGTSEHAMLKMLENSTGIQTVTLCLDNDDAGFKAKVRLMGILHEHGYTSINELTPTLKDWNDDLCANEESHDVARSFGMAQSV